MHIFFSGAGHVFGFYTFIHMVLPFFKVKPVKYLAFVLLLLFVVEASVSQNVTGRWKTIDHETGKAKSIVKIYKNDGKIHGTILKVLNHDNPHELKCDDCPEPWSNKPLVGLHIIRGLEKDDDGWYADEAIVDPERKKVYDCRIWREGDILKVRGYIGWFYATQEWHLAK